MAMEWAVSEQYTPLAFGCGGQPDLCHGWRRHCVQGAAGLTRDELGALAQVSSRLIEQYEQRRRDINAACADAFLSLAQALNCEPSALLERVF